MSHRDSSPEKTPRWTRLPVVLVAALVLGCGQGGDQTDDRPGPSAVGTSPASPTAGSIAVRIIYAVGEIDITRDGAALIASLGDPVFAGDSIVTGSDGECELELGEAGSVYIEPDSIVSVADLVGRVEVDVNDGGVIAKVETLAGLKEFSVRSPTVVAGVRGTEFRVAFNALSQATAIIVREGTVAALPRDLARDALIGATGIDSDRADMIVEQLYANATVVAAGEGLFIDDRDSESLRTAASGLLELIRSAATANNDEFLEQLSAIVTEAENAVAVILRAAPMSSAQQETFGRYDTRQERASAGSAAPQPAQTPDLEHSYEEAMAFTVNKQVATMYYPWFATPAVDGGWNEWDYGGRRPPETWTSRYKPLLGLYSSRDPYVMEQHMQWIRRAGIGTIIAAWFGPNSNDEVIGELLDMAGKYDISVALRIEGDVPSNPSLLPAAIRFLMNEFAPHPAYARLTSESPYVSGRAERPLVFVFDVGDRFSSWASAMAAVRSEPEFPFVLVSGWNTDSVTLGKLDGIAYGSFDRPDEHMYEQVRLLPPGAIYMPSITPGFASADDHSVFTARRSGAPMDQQLEWATSQGATPAMIVIASFNRWADGTQIEPVVQDAGNSLLDFESMGSHGYLDKTRDIVGKFTPLSAVERSRIRIVLSSSSDWATLLLGKVDWGRAEIIELGEGVTESDIILDVGEFYVNQAVESAAAGSTVSGELAIDVPAGASFELGMNKGNLGATTVAVYDAAGLRLGEYVWEGAPPEPAGYEWKTVEME